MRAALAEVVARPAEPRDANKLARLRWEASAAEREGSPQGFEGFRDRFSEFLKAALAGEPWEIWVAERYPLRARWRRSQPRSSRATPD